MRALLSEALRDASDDHGLPAEGDFTAEQEPTIDILAHCVDCWNDFDREALADEWEDASQEPIHGVIIVRGTKSKDGSIRWWIRTTGNHAEKLCDAHSRGALMPIEIETDNGLYDATIRYSQASSSAQINPDLKNTDGEHALSRILTALGIQADKPVEIVKLGNRIRIRQKK